MGVLGVSIIMGLYYWFARLRFGYTFSGMLSQPLGAALVAGLATGKLSEAMVVAGFNLFISESPLKHWVANVPSDPVFSFQQSRFRLFLGVGMNAEAVAVPAVPFGVLGVFNGSILRRPSMRLGVHMADKYAEELNYGDLLSCVCLSSFMGFLIRFPLVFAANFWSICGE